MKLYEINQKLSSVDVLLEETGGELTPEIEKYISGLEIEESKKLENIGLLIQTRVEEKQAIDNQIKRLHEMKKKVDNKINGLKEYVSWYLKQTERQKFSTDLIKFSFRKSQKIEISDISLIPSTFTIKEIKADKKALKEYLKQYIKDPENMYKIEGAKLIENESLQVK